jgi:hypothetical protein
VDHEALARRESEPHPPLLPAQLVIAELEARALRLMDLDGLEIGAGAGHVGRVVRVLRRQRHDAAVLDLQDLHRVQVDDGEEIGDGPRVAVVVGMAPHPRQRAHEPPAFVVGESEVAGRPRVHHRETEIRHPATAHGLLPSGIGADRGRALGELVEHDGRLHAGHVLPGHDAPLRQRDDGLPGLPGGAVQEHDEGGAFDRIAGSVAEHDLLVRLVKRDEDHAALRAGRPIGAQDLPGVLDLGGRERVQRVYGRGGCRGCHARLLRGGWDIVSVEPGFAIWPDLHPATLRLNTDRYSFIADSGTS